MLDKELFFSLCEKYNVELSKTAKTPMIRDAEGVHAITEEDVKQILTPPQKYFDYSNNNINTSNVKPVFDFMDDYATACQEKKYEIIESSFRKKDGSLDDLELGVQVDHSLNKIGDDKFELILTTKVADQDEKVCVWVKGRAIFNTQQENMSILERNAIAILFPYIRSYISTITTQPGMAPILLPAMNIVAMLNDQKKN